MKRIQARFIAKLLVAAFLTHAACMYFRLGFFLPFVWILGSVGFVFATKKDWADSVRPQLAASAVAFSYLLTTIGILLIFAERKHERAYSMTWVDRGNQNDLRESEVVLTFADHPGHYLGIFSTDLAQYLRENGKKSVDVSFAITSDFGCMRGFHQTRIGDRTRWNSQRSYYGSNGSGGASPFGKKGWWCP